MFWFHKFYLMLVPYLIGTSLKHVFFGGTPLIGTVQHGQPFVLHCFDSNPPIANRRCNLLQNIKQT